MSFRDEIAARREEILAIAARHGASNVRLFGSVLRGEERPDSDVDLLVRLEPGRSLFDHSGLKVDLENLLARKVDVVSEDGIYWLIRRKILREAQPI